MSAILVIEDNDDLSYGLRTVLELEGHTVHVAADGAEGLRCAREQRPDLVILDLMLPEMNGYQVLKTLRGEGHDVPVLILTAKGEEAEKVLGFRLGADDYVTKPFGLLELIARVGALLRRRSPAVPPAAESGATPRTFTFGDVVVEIATRRVLRRGRPVTLTPKEFDLLVTLLERDGAIVSRLELLAEVWGHRAAIVPRTVDTHVAELRRKLEDDPTAPRFILTVWKAGYRLDRAGGG